MDLVASPNFIMAAEVSAATDLVASEARVTRHASG